MRNRFCKFYNLPELMQIFSLSADVKLIGDLNIPRPAIHTGKPEVISIEPSEFVKQYILELAERAERIRGGSVDPSVDNMLLVTTQGKSIAIDPRILFPEMEVNRESKIYAVCDKVKHLYDQYNEDKAFQIVFLDSGIQMYEMMKQDLVEQGIPSDEIAFIHDAKTDIQKADLFEKCRKGDIRVLFGYTAKCGAGTNLQDRLIAIHHVDEPWRPRDLTQRNGRGQRQGNRYDEIYIYYYVTKGTFDSYLFQTLEQKQRFISQVMTNQSPARSCDDLDETVLNYAEVKSCATEDTKIKDQMELQNEVQKLQLERASHLTERKRLQELIQSAPEEIKRLENSIANIKQDIHTVQQNQQDDFKITLDGKQYDKRPIAAELLSILVSNSPVGQITPIGEFRGLQVAVDKASGFYPQLLLKGVLRYEIECGESNLGNITKIEYLPKKLQGKLQNMQTDLKLKGNQVEEAKKNANKPFEKEELLKEKAEKLAKIEYEISIELTRDVHLDNEEHIMEEKQQVLVGGNEYEMED